MKRRLGIGVILLALVSGCGTSANGPDGGDSGSSPAEEAKTVDDMRAEIAMEIDVDKAFPEWNCDIAEPKIQRRPMLQRLEALGRDCVWMSSENVIEVDLFCPRTAEIPCDVKLQGIAKRTGAFEGVDVSKMMLVRVIDGLQTSQNGFTSYIGTERGLRLVIDAGSVIAAGLYG